MALHSKPVDRTLMNGDSQSGSGSGVITIEEELSQWPEHVNTSVAEAVFKSQQAKQALEQRKKNRYKYIWAALTGAFVLLFVSAILFWWFERQQTTSTTATGPNATSSNPASLQNSKFNISEEKHQEEKSQASFYKEIDATISENGRDVLKVVQFDFFANKFIFDNTRLINQDALIETFRSQRDSLDGTRVLIFAAASLEGPPDHNLTLCTERLYAVKYLMQSEVGIKAKGYWGISAGEYKAKMEGVKPEDEEEAEEDLANQRGETWLTEQRKLIIVGIKELEPLTPQAAEQVPAVVARHLYDRNLIPKNYDSSGSKPVLLGQNAPVELIRGESRSDNR